jgi:hypothetical protein
MPIGKRAGSDGALYALIAFVFLFIVATTAAVICYLNYEEQRVLADTAQRRIGEIASAGELQKIGALVGTDQNPRKTRLKSMLDYLDQAIGLIVPEKPGDTSAEVKVNEATARVREAVAELVKQNPELADIEPNASLLQATEKLSTTLKNTRSADEATREQLATLQNRFDDAMRVSLEKEKILLDEKDKFQQQFEQVKTGYDELKALLEKKTDEQVKDLYTKLNQERSNRDETNKQLLRTQAELRTADERIQRILKDDVWPIKPPPDANVAAFEPDGKIILVDDQAKIVYINLGSDDRVYRGLTFSIYDKDQPIPRNGKGKAEVEVYNIEKNVSAARILRVDPKNAIVVNDAAANLIWDSKKTNTFVVAGDFDLKGEGRIDLEANEKIRKMVVQWGGKVSDSVTADTDFVILGTPPEVGQKPTLEETETYPNAMERYEQAVERLANYKQVQSQASTLSIPILNAERFLYFIGYKTRAGEPGAF